MMHTCLYCEQWMGSRVVGTKKIKKTKRSIKYCTKRHKKIKSFSRPCRRFKPAKFFHCDKLYCRKNIQVCLYNHAYARVGDKKELYSDCKSCRQYDLIIQPMCEKYGITYGRNIIKLPRRSKKQTNSKKKKNGMPIDFVLPRRKSKPKKNKSTKLPRRRKKSDIKVDKGFKLPRRRRRRNG